MTLEKANSDSKGHGVNNPELPVGSLLFRQRVWLIGRGKELGMSWQKAKPTTTNPRAAWSLRTAQEGSSVETG